MSPVEEAGVTRAEGAVQETWGLRWQASPAQPASAKSFLSATVIRISIDALRSARVRRPATPRPAQEAP